MAECARAPRCWFLKSEELLLYKFSEILAPPGLPTRSAASGHGGGGTEAAEPRHLPPRPLHRQASCSFPRSTTPCGAAIASKGELESIDEESLRSACAQLRQAMSDAAAPGKVMGMDWSRRPGDPGDRVVDAEGFAGMAGLGLDSNFVVVHGAGSFGHFQASRSGVHKGGLHSTLAKAGFVATRISVTSLNQEIVRALAREGIPSVGMSLACGWSTQQRNLASANASQIIQSLHASFVPVLHGDAVLDELLDCTILSGDVIIRHLAQLLSPKYVVFLLVIRRHFLVHRLLSPTQKSRPVSSSPTAHASISKSLYFLNHPFDSSTNLEHLQQPRH